MQRTSDREGVSLSHLEGGRGIEGEGGDPMNRSFWNRQADEHDYERVSRVGEASRPKSTRSVAPHWLSKECS